RDRPSGTAMSQAISGASHSMVVAPRALPAIFATDWLRFAALGLEISVATSAIGVSGFAGEGAMLKGATLIAGPTASGKSARALERARRNGGVIINTDSMQVYSVLRLLTARPGEVEMAEAPHRLFGHVHPSQPYSTGGWTRDVEALLLDPILEGRPAIFV